MPNNEVERSFPRPPRRFSSDFLDPMLVVEDYEETVGMVRRFARDNPDFTEDDLLHRLANNGVYLYGTQKEWDRLFTGMRNKIVKEAAKKKPPVEVTWVTQQLGGMATYTMVEVESVEEVQAEAPVMAVEPERLARRAEPSREPVAPSVQADTIRAMLGAAPDGMMRPKDLIDAVAKQFRLDDGAATVAIDTALLTNQIMKTGHKGTMYITASTGEPAQKRPTARPETEEAEERLLSDDELTMVISVLDKLAEGHVTTGVTIKNLESLLHSSYSRDHFRRLLRILESQRLIRFDTVANYKQARKSPRVHLRGQDTKNRWQANRDGYINRLKQAKIRLKGEA